MSEIEDPRIAFTNATGYSTIEEVKRETTKEIQHVEDHPVEDMFGTEIHPGDGYFILPNGQVVDAVNVEDYFIEILKAVAFIAKK